MRSWSTSWSRNFTRKVRLFSKTVTKSKRSISSLTAPLTHTFLCRMKISFWTQFKYRDPFWANIRSFRKTVLPIAPELPKKQTFWFFPLTWSIKSRSTIDKCWPISRKPWRSWRPISRDLTIRSCETNPPFLHFWNPLITIQCAFLITVSKSGPNFLNFHAKRNSNLQISSGLSKKIRWARLSRRSSKRRSWFSRFDPSCRWISKSCSLIESTNSLAPSIAKTKSWPKSQTFCKASTQLKVKTMDNRTHRHCNRKRPLQTLSKFGPL